MWIFKRYYKLQNFVAVCFFALKPEILFTFLANYSIIGADWNFEMRYLYEENY